MRSRVDRLVGSDGKRTAREIWQELGRIMWDHVGMARNESGLKQAIDSITNLRGSFWDEVRVTGVGELFNKELELAGRVADYLELGELMARDALERRESCGGHFREESATPEGEALRDDENYSHVSAWQYKGDEKTPQMHKEELSFDHVQQSQRSYK